MSPELKAFYKDLQAWIENPETSSFKFVADYGICDNLSFWVFAQPQPYETWRLALQLKGELIFSFPSSGLDTCLPFDTSLADFKRASKANTLYKNKARLDWIAHHAKI